MLRKIVRVALFALFGLAVSFIILIGLLVVAYHDHDPFDHFEVIGVASDPASNSSAVSYDYQHADSSNRLVATWIIPNPAPTIGSKEPVSKYRRLVLVGAGPSGLVWSNGWLQVNVKTQLEVRTDPYGCFFEYDNPSLICFDPDVVSIVSSQ